MIRSPRKTPLSRVQKIGGLTISDDMAGCNAKADFPEHYQHCDLALETKFASLRVEELPEQLTPYEPLPRYSCPARNRRSGTDFDYSA